MRKKDRTEEAHDFSGLPAPRMVSAADIQAKEFGVSRFGGYRMRDVDEFLDELTASVTKLTEENERLRAGAGVPSPSIGAPDLEDSARQADEIIERARVEAARTVRDAGDRAASTGEAGATTTGGGDRAAVTAFLAREREFLQSLATLVQGHAETIKGMAKASRPAPTSTAPAAEAPSGPATPPPTDAGPAPSEPAAPAEVPPARGDDPIRVDEPATATVARGEGDDEAEQNQAEGDRSLRELFWGED
jgi:DivIVA domain-containing protein